MRSIVPNTLTMANLFFGLLAIMAIFRGEFTAAAWLVSFSLLFDFLDGFVARLLKVSSELGKQLDSLADVVTFGVVPGLLMFKTFEYSYEQGWFSLEILKYCGLLIAIFSALRLGKFNIDERQTTYFIGLPTPANTIFLFSYVLTALWLVEPGHSALMLHPISLLVLSVLCSWLLIAEIPLMSLKIKSWSWSSARGIYLLLIAVIILFVLFKLAAFVFIIPLYLLLSLIYKPHQK